MTSESTEVSSESRLQKSPQTPAAPERQITLQVGSKHFTTRAETLEESGFFAALLSDRWQFQAQNDCAIFIDADAELFVHVLRYLRRGVLPIFFDKVKGHDYSLYLALLEEARYFQIPRLEKWLHERRYLAVVNTVYSATVVPGLSLERAKSLAAPGTDEEVTFFPHWKVREVYICPRGIEDHRDNPSSCGRKCKNAASEVGTYNTVTEEILEILMVKKQTLFNHNLCVEGR